VVAPVTTYQLLHDGARNAVVKATFLSGGLDQGITTLVNAAALNPPAGIHMKIMEIDYDATPGGIVRIYWDAPPSPVDILDMNGFDHQDYRAFGGIQNSGGANATGNILVSTQGFTLGYNYTIILKLNKAV
jgi:hypothetical protein